VHNPDGSAQRERAQGRIGARGAVGKNWSESSELLAESGILANAVRSVARLYAPIDRHMAVGDWAVPDFVIALARPDKVTAALFEMFAKFAI
jgi:hypothetical protein